MSRDIIHLIEPALPPSGPGEPMHTYPETRVSRRYTRLRKAKSPAITWWLSPSENEGFAPESEPIAIAKNQKLTSRDRSTGAGCEACPETSVKYVVKHNTSKRTSLKPCIYRAFRFP